MIDGELKVNETAVTHMQLKSFVARVTKDGSGYKVLGVVLNDGTPIKSVEVKVDDGPWQTATMDPATKEKFGWKFFTYTWNGATPGDHTIVSRVTDVTGSGAADREGSREQEVVPRGELAGAAQAEDRLARAVELTGLLMSDSSSG